MKKRKKIALIVAIVFVIVYIGVKVFCFYAYNMSKPPQEILDLKKAFDNRNSITIKRNNEKEDDYFSFDSLKIRNVFEKENETENIYKIKGTDVLVRIGKVKKDHLVSPVEEESKTMGLFYDLTKDFEKNGIDTDYKLYEYLFNNMNLKLNIFSSIHSLRKSMAINESSTLLLSSFNNLILINGDYDGYILEMNKVKEVNIYHNDVDYYIIIHSDNYSNESLYDLLSTISFN